MTQQRTFHGDITPDEVAAALVAEFNRGNYRAQQVGSGDKAMVQIATREGRQSGGATALTVTLQKVEDGVTVALGEQDLLGTAASLAQTGLGALVQPLSLISRLDDLAQDFSSLTLSDQVWAAIEKYAKAAGAAKEISQRLRTVTCPNCGTANKVGEPKCVACSAPLGDVQPKACKNCGHVMEAGAKFCSNCGAPLSPSHST